jgi:hypothetical protein
MRIGSAARRAWPLFFTIVVATTLAHDPLAASPTYQAIVQGDGPVLYYQLNEITGTTVINHGSLGASHNGTYQGAPTRGVPTFSGDSGVKFNGLSDYIQSLGVAPASLTGNPSFTVEAVVHLPSTAISILYAPFLNWGDTTSLPDGDIGRSGRSAWFGFQGQGGPFPNGFRNKVFAGFYNGGVVTDPIAFDTWHHVVWVRNSAGGTNSSAIGNTLYVDGVQVSAVVDTQLLAAVTPAVDATVFRINRGPDFVSSPGRYFTGSLDEVALYDRQLTATEVFEHASALFCGGSDPTRAFFTSVTRTTLAWCPMSTATGYDVVRGDLTLLRSSGGNFTTATVACLVNDDPTISTAYSLNPPVAGGIWFLVRVINAGVAGTYDSGAPSQVGSRDAEITASGADCAP